MHFANFISALAAIASITSALQDIPSADTSFIARRASLAKKPQPTKQSTQLTHSTPSSQVSVCKGKKAAHKLRFMPRGDPQLVSHVQNVWYVYEDGFLQASEVNYGEYSRVWDVTGCSAAFFFDTAGRASVAHLRAGEETAQAREAASQARDAGTFDSVTVYSPSLHTTRDIKNAILACLGGA